MHTGGSSVLDIAGATESIPAPEGLSYLPYQLEAIRFMLAREGVLVGDEMGLGKTVEVIGLINTLPSDGRILIVCPATIRLVWKMELEKWLLTKRPIQIIKRADEVFSTDKSAIIIINYDKAYQYRSQLLGELWSLVIADECHYLRNAETKRSSVVLATKARRRVALSGTPLESRPVELRPVLTWLDSVAWPLNKWHEYGLRYCRGFWDGFKFDFSGASDLDVLNQRLRDTVMIRRLKVQVLPQLPAKFRSIVELSPSTDLQVLLQDELDAFTRWQEHKSEDGYKAQVADLKVYSSTKTPENLARLRQQVALAKAPMVAAYARELFKGGVKKLVIFAHHHSVVSFLAKALTEYCPGIITGETSLGLREQVLTRFHEDPACRLFIGNIQAAGTGITLAPAANHCLFAEFSWLPSQMSQAEDRLHRVGTRDNVLAQYMVLSGSLDAIMAKILLKKQEVLDSVLAPV